MLDPTDAFASMLAELRTSVFSVYEDQPPEDADIDWNDGLFRPYLVASFGGPVRSARDRSLVTTRWDATILTFVVEAHAPTATAARQIQGEVIDLMTGFRATDCGELTLEMVGRRTRASNSIRPTVHIAAVGFSCVSNLSTE